MAQMVFSFGRMAPICVGQKPGLAFPSTHWASAELGLQPVRTSPEVPSLKCSDHRPVFAQFEVRTSASEPTENPGV